MNPDQYLIQRLKESDSKAFEEIFSKYYKDMVMFALTIVRNLENSEEIVSDVFVQLWEEREKLNITIPTKYFLLKIIQNRCFDLYRHQKIINRHTLYVIDNAPVFECNTDKFILYSEMNEAINKTLQKMPEVLRSTYCMNRFEGLKYREIATRLNVSVRTIEVRISKALEFLRDDLKEFLE